MAKVYVFTEYGGPDVQRFVDLPIPTPTEAELLVKVHAAGVNPADWKRRSNFAGNGEPITDPVPMGREVAGIVEAVGDGAGGFAVGDRVFGSVKRYGGWAEYSIVDVDRAARIPEGVSFDDAATLPVAACTAYDGIVQLHPEAGETIVITGAGGGVGIAAVQIALARGARVIGTASTAKRELLESLGAVAVAYGEGEVQRVRELSPDGVDALYDNVGGSSLRALAALVNDKSRLIASGDRTTIVEVGGVAVARNPGTEVLKVTAAMVADGTLKPFVTQVFPLDQAAEAMSVVEGGHATGKVVIEVN